MPTRSFLDIDSIVPRVTRILSVILFCRLTFILLGGGIPGLNLLTLGICAILFGCILGWFTERYAGLTVLSAGAFYYIAHKAEHNFYPQDYYFPFIFVLGFMFLLSDLLQPKE